MQSVKDEKKLTEEDYRAASLSFGYNVKIKGMTLDISSQILYNIRVNKKTAARAEKR